MKIYFRLQVRISCVTMAKRTRKVGITGKYGTRYGASLRKVVKKEPGQILLFLLNLKILFMNLLKPKKY